MLSRYFEQLKQLSELLSHGRDFDFNSINPGTVHRILDRTCNLYSRTSLCVPEVKK